MKTKRRFPANIMFDPAIFEWIVQQAETNDCSMSRIIEAALVVYMEKVAGEVKEGTNENV